MSPTTSSPASSPRTRPSAATKLFATADVGTLDLRPPIHRFLERWTPGDPFVHLGPAVGALERRHV